MRMVSTPLPPTGGTARVAGFGPLVVPDTPTGTAHQSPSARPSPFIGRALREFAPLVVQAVVIALIMVPFGFRPDAGGGVLGLVLLGVLGVGIRSLSYALAIAVREQDWMFRTVPQTVLFPLMALSGMLLPLDEGPQWIRVLAQFNPLTHVVEDERGLSAEQIVPPGVGALIGPKVPRPRSGQVRSGVGQGTTEAGNQ